MKSDSSKSANPTKLPRIALIADVANWAFHNHAEQLAKRLSGSYEFQIFFYGDYPEIENLMLEIKDFDLIHFFWRDALFSFLSEWVRASFAEKNWNYEDFVSNILANANITTSVFDHLLLSESEVRERIILFNALTIGYTTCSKKLDEIYSSISEYPRPNCLIENGVDLDLFVPFNLERLSDENKEVVVGWAGNSKWGGEGIDHKGLETIIKPAIESLRAEGYKVRGDYADRQEDWLPHDQMNDYYNSIDIYVCASDTEGSPDPVLESMACGLPVVSTDVGIVPEVFGALQKEYILPSRSVEDLKTKLKELIINAEQRALLSKENLESIKQRSWEKQCIKWDKFFKTILSNSHQPQFRHMRNNLRKQSLEMYLTLNSNRDLIYNLENSIKESQALLTGSENRTSELENRVFELDAWSKELQTALSNSESRISELENRLSELDNWNKELQAALTKADRQIESTQLKSGKLQTRNGKPQVNVPEKRNKSNKLESRSKLNEKE
jgi:glycosyltransferase involved in cell wall biosynthesis